jgi:hypothetical protein
MDAKAAPIAPDFPFIKLNRIRQISAVIKEGIIAPRQSCASLLFLSGIIS